MNAAARLLGLFLAVVGVGGLLAGLFGVHGSGLGTGDPLMFFGGIVFCLAGILIYMVPPAERHRSSAESRGAESRSGIDWVAFGITATVGGWLCVGGIVGALNGGLLSLPTLTFGIAVIYFAGKIRIRPKSKS